MPRFVVSPVPQPEVRPEKEAPPEKAPLLVVEGPGNVTPLKKTMEESVVKAGETNQALDQLTRLLDERLKPNKGFVLKVTKRDASGRIAEVDVIPK